MEAEQIDHVNIRIPERGVEEAVKFYRDKLGFQPEKLELYRDGERTSFAFRMGETSMLHVRPVEDFSSPDDTNYDHFCILVSREIGEVKEELKNQDVELEREGNPWGSTGRAPAIYIKDPFGYTIEIKEATSSPEH